MNTLTKVAKAIKYSLITSVSASLLTVPVYAQEEGTGDKVKNHREDNYHQASEQDPT